jgi:prephenate dehydratase
MKTIFLGPYGATFSHDAYTKLARTYGALPATEFNYLEATTNSKILDLAVANESYATIAMETRAGGRVAEPVESFIKLLHRPCPIHVIGALSMKIGFCLMGKVTSVFEGRKILAHPKALEACRQSIEICDRPTIETSSNGEAARLVSEDPSYADCLALAPASAAEKYGLTIFNSKFEYTEAATTFFLIGPKSHPVKVGKKNRVLIVYKVPHEPGALVKSLLPFDEQGLNLIQIHSVHAGNCTYNFAIELDVDETQLEAFAQAKQKFDAFVDTHLCFGPFEVLSE